MSSARVTISRGLVMLGMLGMIAILTHCLFACQHSLGARYATSVEQPPLPIIPDTNQVYSSPPWTYDHKRVDRSYGRYGQLFFNHRDLSIRRLGTRGINDYYKTPWGEMYWHGRPGIRYLPTGWMPFPTWRHGAGKLLPTPEIL